MWPRATRNASSEAELSLRWKVGVDSKLPKKRHLTELFFVKFKLKFDCHKRWANLKMGFCQVFVGVNCGNGQQPAGMICKKKRWSLDVIMLDLRVIRWFLLFWKLSDIVDQSWCKSTELSNALANVHCFGFHYNWQLKVLGNTWKQSTSTIFT